MDKKSIFITVIGEGNATKETSKLAFEVGKLVAQAGAVLICGGLSGVMEAAAKGAKSAGGLTIGILPGSRREEANPYIDIPIITGLGYARNKLVVKTGQVVIAVGGSYGTLSEIAFALGYRIPVIGLKTWELIKRGKIDDGIIPVETPKQAINLALKFIREKKIRKGKSEYKT